MEANLRRAITIDNGDWWTLVDSPLSLGLWAIAIIGFVMPIIFGRVVKNKMRQRKDEEGAISD
jgi:putative tricarboxylic transport membrane protein